MKETHIFGGGLAGLLIAQQLIDAGLTHITLHDNADSLKASDAPLAICHPFPGRSLAPHPLLFTAYRETQRWMNRWMEWDPRFVQILPMTRPAFAKGADRLYASWQRVWQNQVHPDLHITATEDKMVQYGPCYTVRLGALCVEWIRRLGQQGVVIQTAQSIDPMNTPGRRVFCTGRHLGRWFPDLHVHTEGGELGTFVTHQPLKTLISGGGHVAPNSKTTLVAGATRWTHPPETLDHAQTELHTIAQRLWPHVAGPVDLWQGTRCIVKSDRLPVAGAVPDSPNTYVLGAFGSKGLLWGPYAAHCLAQLLIDGIEIPSPLATDRLPRFQWRLGSTKPDLKRE